MEQSKLEDARGSWGKCLICQRKGTDSEPTKRGLCVNHYARFYRNLQKVFKQFSAPEIWAFEDRLISKGLLLPSRQGKKDEEDDPFQEIADDFIAQEKQRRADLGLPLKGVLPSKEGKPTQDAVPPVSPRKPRVRKRRRSE